LGYPGRPAGHPVTQAKQVTDEMVSNGPEIFTSQ
jgi:hypothetical protein